MRGLSTLLLSFALTLAAAGDVLRAEVGHVPDGSTVAVEATAFVWYQSPTIGGIALRGWRVRLARPAFATNAAGQPYAIADGDLVLFATVEETGELGPRRFRLVHPSPGVPVFYAPACSNSPR